MTDTRKLVLGPMPGHADPKNVIAMGPWCFAGREEAFPDFEKRFTFAPEPRWERDADPLHAVTALCQRSLRPLADTLAPGNTLPDAYWEMLLLPWLAQVCEQIVERWQRIRMLKEAFSDEKLVIPIDSQPGDFAFANEEEYTLRGALGAGYNTWLFSILLRQTTLPPSWKLVSGDQEKVKTEDRTAEKRGLRALLSSLLMRLPFPHLKGVSIVQSLLLSLALLHDAHGPDESCPLADMDTGDNIRERLDLTFDEMPIVRASIPKSLRSLAHPESIRKSGHPRVRCASIVAYEDAVYRQRLAIARAAGHRLFFVQHGGNYGQVRMPCRTAIVEYSQHRFITWGWSSYGGIRGHFLPLPYPQLARIKNAAREMTETILLVGTEMPLYNYRLDSHPCPGQMLSYRMAKKRFLDALPAELRSRVLYRPYFPLPSSLEDFTWLSRMHPEIARCEGPLTPALLATRLLVLDHHGTTLLEAMAANVPLVVCFSMDQWQLSDECREFFEKLARAEIFFSTPEACARHIAAIWPDIRRWWNDSERQDARTRFVEQYARLSKTNETALWQKTLKNL